ncbi:uncharacterized protein LOC6570042 [Drosophila grimshawi]|uniref:GH25129 n=1 Tax=Drosophila grimshawi TaxID=7222 RepID=B4JZF5_DROGR|nr:uncharacterized protein LOC6570042 [Drosophila grimshawi]EDV94077.1 GH25129 [Drosophila grimshawi]
MDLRAVYACLYVITTIAIGALGDYVVLVDHFDFEPVDRELIVSNSAFIEQEGNRSYISGHLQLGRTLNEIIMLTSMDISRPRLPRVRLFDTKLDLCAFLNNAYRSKFVRHFYKRFVNFVNIQPTCPIQAHINYSLTRSYLDESVLPELLPACSYFLKVEIRNRTSRFAIIHLSGYIRPVVVRTTTPKHQTF